MASNREIDGTEANQKHEIVLNRDNLSHSREDARESFANHITPRGECARAHMHTNNW
jgi:hypothetical protein